MIPLSQNAELNLVFDEAAVYTEYNPMIHDITPQNQQRGEASYTPLLVPEQSLAQARARAALEIMNESVAAHKKASSNRHYEGEEMTLSFVARKAESSQILEIKFALFSRNALPPVISKFKIYILSLIHI